MTIRNCKYLDEPYRIGLKEIIGGEGDPPPIENVTIKLFGSSEEAGNVAMSTRCKPIIQMREENCRQVTHDFGVQKIIAHKALDSRPAIARRKMRAFGKLDLHVERQSILRPTGNHMQVTTDGPQEVFRLLKLVQFLPR